MRYFRMFSRDAAYGAICDSHETKVLNRGAARIGRAGQAAGGEKLLVWRGVHHRRHGMAPVGPVSLRSSDVSMLGRWTRGHVVPFELNSRTV